MGQDRFPNTPVLQHSNSQVLRSHKMRETSVHKKITRLALCTLLFAYSFPAAAQQPKKVPRIGYLSSQEPGRESARSEAIRLALRELGYIERQNIAIEYRYAEGKRDRLP